MKPTDTGKGTGIVRSYFIFAGICAVFLTGFGRMSLQEPIAAEFMITNSAGTVTDSLRQTEDVYFSYRLTNTGDEPVKWWKPDGGPVAFVQIYKDGALIGSTMDQSFYTQAIEKGILQSGETLTWKQSWMANGLHDPLPPGTYSAVLRPRLTFEGTPLSTRESRFQITEEQ